MKKILLLIALTTPIFTFASILTVDNSNTSPGQYTSFNSAYNAANSGDTIYVRGSLHSYGDITIMKKIILIGAGYNPSPANTFPTIFDNINIGKGSAYDASGTKIYGVIIANPNKRIKIYGSSYYGDINNVVIERCEGYIYTNYCSGAKIINNIITKMFVNDNTRGNTIVSNNIIKKIDFSTYYSSNSITFDHNIFTNDANSEFRYCIVKNSIFYGTAPGSNATYTTFANNMAYASANDTFDISSNNNSGYNNLNHSNPNFVSVNSTTFDYTYDYHLQNGSPGISAATDGTNIGIYGGLYPMPIGGASLSGYQTSQEPAIPQIYEMHIFNQTVLPADSLNVNIKVSIQK